MINREWKTVSILTYTNTIDSYGQKKTGTPSSRNVEMVVKDYSHTDTDDIRYDKVTKLGITKDTTITDKNEVIIDTVKYYITHTLPSSKYLQVFMVKK